MSDYAGGDTKANIPPLQTVVQLNIYRQKGGRFEYLLLKRIDTDSKFWQVITEPVHHASTLGDTLRHAASEQVGLRGFKHLSHETYSYEWYTHGERGRDIVFAAEISPEATITLDQHRYNAFEWLPIDEAARRLKWDGNRAALKKLDDHLVEAYPIQGGIGQDNRHSERLDQQPQTSQQYSQNQQSYPVPNNPSADAYNNTNNPPASNGPYGSNVPRRLPDQPSAVAAAPVREINPGELFL